MASFYGRDSTASRLELLWGGSSLCTTKFPEILATHFIDLGRMKGWVFFNNVQMLSMTDLCIRRTPAFRLTEEDFKGAIQEGPTYICEICWKFELWKNVIKLKESKYQTDL